MRDAAMQLEATDPSRAGRNHYVIGRVAAERMFPVLQFKTADNHQAKIGHQMLFVLLAPAFHLAAVFPVAGGSARLAIRKGHKQESTAQGQTGTNA